MTTTTEIEPAGATATDPLTLAELLAAQLCSTHVVDGRLVQVSAVADGTYVAIDIEHPFPPGERIRLMAHLSVVLPGSEADNGTEDGALCEDETAGLGGVEIRATA